MPAAPLIPRAVLFGNRDIEAIMGAEARLPLAARRQIMAAPGYPDLGRDRSIAVRLASGMTSRLVSFLASRIETPATLEATLQKMAEELARR